MRSWKLNLVTVLVLVGAALAAPSDSRDETQNSLDDLNPVNAEDGNQLEGLDREKRKLPEAVFGTKNAVLGFVFSGSSKASALPSSFSGPKKIVSKNVGVVVGNKTDDVPEFDRNKVRLDIPDKLYQNSFQTVTGISKVAGQYMLNSARRFAHLVDLFRPLFGKGLTIKGIHVPPPGTKLKIKSETVVINKV